MVPPHAPQYLHDSRKQPLRTSGAPPTHRYYALDGYCTWLWRRLSDSSPCPLRVLQGSPDRHSTTNPKQLATKQLAITAAHAATISYNVLRTPKTSTATAASCTNQTKDLTAKHGQHGQGDQLPPTQTTESKCNLYIPNE